MGSRRARSNAAGRGRASSGTAHPVVMDALAHVAVLNQVAVALASERKLDEALSLLSEAVSVAPRHVPSHNNRGAVQMMQGDLHGAAESYQMALAIDRRSTKGHFNLANIYRTLGCKDDAIEHLKRVLELEPSHHSASHLLAATRGTTTEHAPVDYVRELFDQYAGTFEQVLTRDLQYQTPQMLRDLLVEHAGPQAHFARAVDLGCGTGLSGVAFRPYVGELSGVDVSIGMLKKAGDKQLYASLFQVEMVEYLRKTPESFDLFIAADALIYLGNLDALFTQLSQRAVPLAYVALSVEHTVEGRYVLTQSGRYAHSTDYIRELAAKHGMSVIDNKLAALRKDGGREVVGELFLLKTCAHC